MAVPTITSVTPSRGHTGGGTVLRVVGTNFKLPDAPPPPGAGPVPAPPATVRVFVGDVEARTVRVASSTVLYVTTEKRDPGSALSVEVRNVGSLGETIGSEVATKLSAYEYARPVFTNGSVTNDLERVVKRLHAELVRQVYPEVVITEHVDWTSDPLSILRGVANAKAPCVFLAGPTLRPNRVYRTNVRPTTAVKDAGGEVVTNVVREHRAPLTDDVVFVIGALADKYTTLLALAGALRDFQLRNPRLELERDGAETGDLISYDLTFEGDLTVDSSPDESNVRSCSTTVSIDGFDWLPGQGFESDQAITVLPTVVEEPEVLGEVRRV